LVSKPEFKALVENDLENAAQNAEKTFEVSVPRRFQIDLIGAGKQKRLLTPDEVVDDLYIDAHQFWLLINVMVTEILPDSNMTIISMNVSGHGPGPFEKPFNIRREREHSSRYSQ
jgi:hypothetical protein